MNAKQFRKIRQGLPLEIARSNAVLGKMLGVSHHSISKYQNMDGDLPAYIANGITMLALICEKRLLLTLQMMLQGST